MEMEDGDGGGRVGKSNEVWRKWKDGESQGGTARGKQ